MLTPFTDAGVIDWTAYDELIEWHLECGAAGLFSVCLSSELYCIDEYEKLRLARVAVARAGGRVPVIAAGAIGPVDAMAEFTRRLAGEGVDAVVCLSNQFDGEAGSDAWKAGVSRYLDLVPAHIRLGIYECPVPRVRHLTAAELGWLASTGRFLFTKDTCCDIAQIRAKLAATAGTALKFYNADSVTLLESLGAGGHGYSGIAGNYFGHLFSWLCARHAERPADARELSAFFKESTGVVHHKYMQSAKHHLSRAGLGMGTFTRVARHEFSGDELAALDALRLRVEAIGDRLGLANPFARVRRAVPGPALGA